MYVSCVSVWFQQQHRQLVLPCADKPPALVSLRWGHGATGQQRSKGYLKFQKEITDIKSGRGQKALFATFIEIIESRDQKVT